MQQRDKFSLNSTAMQRNSSTNITVSNCLLPVYYLGVAFIELDLEPLTSRFQVFFFLLLYPWLLCFGEPARNILNKCWFIENGVLWIENEVENLIQSGRL